MGLYAAQLDDIWLEIETLDDQFESAIARHEFPFKDGALLENMGQKARTVTMRCYFWDDGQHQTYDDHVKLINHLRDKNLFELVHPMYGSMTGMIERVNVRADDRQMTAEVDITFVENLRQDISEFRYEDVESAADQTVIDTQDEQVAQFEDAARAALGSEAARIVAQELAPELGILEQFNNVSLKARLWLKQVDTAVIAFQAAANDVAQPANSLISTIAFGTNLPGRVIGSLARLADRYVALYTSTTTAPSRFLLNLQTAMDNLTETSELPAFLLPRLRVGVAIQGSAAVAHSYATDEQQRQVLRRLEKQSTFDTLGRYLNPAQAEPVYTINELEASLFACRNALQTAVERDNGRSVPSLKVMARLLLDHVNTIKLEREKIITIELDNPMPLHIVCLRYGLDYHYAERITAINTIPQPNFTGGSLQIYISGANR